MILEAIGNLVGRNTTPAAKVMSAIVSILTVGFIFFNLKPEWNTGAFAFLLFHAANHLYVGLNEFKIPTCPDCGVKLKYKMKIEKHKCKKKKDKK